ncbi:bone morphogenetic protein 1 homolog [Ptychodera flava]|uniref:bone morphogenetic protein 1 homolog n=1 Tax=Ptychodera flava TaxID=63121 RepID=UPI00396A2D0D
MEQNIILCLAVLILIADVWLACCDKARHEEATWMEYSDDIVVQRKVKIGDVYNNVSFTSSLLSFIHRLNTDIRRIGDCGGTWTSNSGAITSPSYPNRYGIFEDCIYNITVSSGYFIELTFTSFRTEACCDTVNVYNGDEITDPLLGSFSGEGIPNTVTSSGPMLLIHFQSDSSFNADGFYAVYDTKTNLDGPPSYNVCDDVNVHGLGGLIYSHKDYPAGSPKLSFVS